jgi:uncharacterized repeat protein (TIGR02543 family)
MRFLYSGMALIVAFLLSNQAVAATQYEAENATLSGAAKKNTNHPGYTGTGFVDGFYYSTTAQASFAVTMASAGSATVTLRYSAGNGTSTNTGLYVNGTKIKNITCNTTSNWDTWATQVETVTLNAGNNTIAYKAETSVNTCINLDYISVQEVTTTYALTVTATNGTVTKSPNATTYTSGTVVSLTAVPATGYQFTGWSGDLTGTANPASITMNSAKNVTANFTILTYALTVTAANGTVAKSPNAATYASGTVVSLTAVPATGYQFTGWSGDLTGTANPASITMNSAKNVTANFTSNPLTLTMSNDGHGSTTPATSAVVTYGVPAAISATPATGYTFSTWTVTAGSATFGSATSASTTVTLTTSATIRANFIATTPTGVSAVTYAEISSPVTVTADNTIVLALPFTAPSAGYVTVTATGLYGTTQAYSHEQRGLESFITLNSTSGGSLSGFVDKPNVQNGALYVSETAGFQVSAGSNTVRLIVSPRTTLIATAYKFVKCRMTVVFSQQKM